MDTLVLLLLFSLCLPVVELSSLPPLECRTTGDQVPWSGKNGSALELPDLLVTMLDNKLQSPCSETQLLIETTGWHTVLSNPKTDGREETSCLRHQPIEKNQKHLTNIYLNN